MKKLDLTQTPEQIVAAMGVDELQETLERAQKHDAAIKRRNLKAYLGSGKKRQIELAKFRTATFKAAKERAAKEELQRQNLGGNHGVSKK